MSLQSGGTDVWSLRRFLVAIAAAAACWAAPDPATATCYEAPFPACPTNDAAKSVLIPATEFPTSAHPADSRPMAFVDANDGSRRRYVPLLGGRVLLWKGGEGISDVDFLDLSAKVLSHGDPGASNEQGLVALTFHPRYAENGFLYVMYVGNGGAAPSDSGDLVIERYTRSTENPEVADPTSAQAVLVIDHEESQFHYGGSLAFGLDGLLYASTGDGGGPCDGPVRDGQTAETLRGKILRLDVDSNPGSTNPECKLGGSTHDGNYRIPADNPLRGAAPGCGEVLAIGLRNPFRFTIDRSTGDLFIGDVGQDNWEELNHLSASNSVPVNFGWICREGCDASFTGESACSGLEETSNCANYAHGTCEYPSANGYMDPNLCFSNADGWATIVPGYRYRGPFVPTLTDRLLLADPFRGEIWATPPDDLFNASCWDAGNEGIFAFGEDHLGELYIVNGVEKRIECIHGSHEVDGCYWATWGGIFEDGFETHGTAHWSQATGEK